MKQRWYHKFLFTPQEQKYAKHYVKSHMRLGIVTLLFLTLFVMGLLVPVSLLNFSLTLFGGANYDDSFTFFTTLFIGICILAYLLPMMQFRFIMKRTSSDLYLSLPIERKRLFYIHYLMGLLYLIGAALFETIVPALILLGRGSYLYQYSWMNMAMKGVLLILILIVLGCCLYTFFTYVIIRCHTLLDSIMICGIYTILPVLVFQSVLIFIYRASSQMMLSTYVSLSGIDYNIERLYSLIGALLSVPWQMNRWTQIFFSTSFYNDYYTWQLLSVDLIVWIVIAVACYRGARNQFIRLRSEESEQPTKSFFTYPFLIPLMTFFLLLCVGEGKLFSWGIAIIFAGYLIAYFFAQRKISMDLKKLVMYVGMVLLCSLCYRIFIVTHAFGTITEVPKKEISAADIYIRDTVTNESYSAHFPKLQEDLSLVIAEHEALLPHVCKDCEPESVVAIIEFYYEMGENNFIERTYELDQSEAAYFQELVMKWKEAGFIGEIETEDTEKYE